MSHLQANGVNEIQNWLIVRSLLCAAAFLFAFGLALLPCAASAQIPPHIPPPGIAVPDNDRQELTTNAAAFAKEISDLETRLKSDASHRDLLPDVAIFHKAVDWALRYDEFFETRQISFAKTLLRQGRERAEQLRWVMRPGCRPLVSSSARITRNWTARSSLMD